MTAAGDRPAGGDASRDGGRDTQLAERVEDAVLAAPAVARLDRGPLGAVVSYLPGRVLGGVRVNEPDGRVEVSVVLHLGNPAPAVADDLRARVRGVAGDVPVDVTVADLVAPGEDADG